MDKRKKSKQRGRKKQLGKPKSHIEARTDIQKKNISVKTIYKTNRYRQADRYTIRYTVW